MIIIKIEWTRWSSRKCLAGRRFLRRALEPWTEGWEEGEEASWSPRAIPQPWPWSIVCKGRTVSGLPFSGF